MMDSYSLIGYAVLWALVITGVYCWYMISNPGKWIIKAILSAGLIVLLFGTILVARELQGTPKLGVDLNGMLVRAYVVEEPRGNSPGKIWMWVTDPFGAREPLSVAMPYSKKMHRQLMENKGLQEGRPQLLRRKPATKQGKESDKDGGNSDDDGLELVEPTPGRTIKT